MPKIFEDNFKVSSLETWFKLPEKNNKGHPPKKYNDTKKELCPIIKYTTINHLAGPLKGFVNQISAIIIPKKIEVKKDPKWIYTMNVEMDALEKNNT
jgi:hypothetical protein